MFFFQAWLPALREEVQQVREEAQEHVRAPLSLLPGHPGWGYRDRGRVQAPQQDRQVQHAEGDQGQGQQEVLLQVLTYTMLPAAAAVKTREPE